MTGEKDSLTPLRFRGWELRRSERTLWVNGSRVALGERAFDVLVVLSERAGELVTKTELLDIVWHGRVVEESNISVHISAIRKALGPDVVKANSGKGYRLTAALDAATESTAATVAPSAEDLSSYRTDLLGRESEVGDVLECLARHRVTSIVGSGGVGKTSLAREAVARTSTFGQASIHWVDLTPVQTGQELVSVLAKSLGVESTCEGDVLGELADALATRSGLVVLDNCEHVLTGAANCIKTVTARAPGLKWLVTSQAPLRITGEALYRLQPLATPPEDAPPAQAIEFGAVALFCRRVVEGDRRFRLDGGNARLAVGLCRQLDGLPLAIEMAAARVATLGLREVHDRLGRRLRLLKGPKSAALRHSTLAATFDWSYGLLSENEQRVFRFLEPFLGGFRSDIAGSAMHGTSGEPLEDCEFLEILGELIDRSLVQRAADGSGHFYLLESARHYAISRLESAGEVTEARSCHMRAVAKWLASAPEHADRMTDDEWKHRYAAEFHNARAAMLWANQEGNADELAITATAVAMIDTLLCRQSEVLRCEISMAVLDKASPPLRAHAHLELSWAHYFEGDRALGTHLAQRAFDTFSANGMSARAYRALAQLTRLHEARPGHADEARDLWLRLQAMDRRSLPLRTVLFCDISCGLLHRPGFTTAHMEELGRRAARAGFTSLAAICAGNATDKMLIAGENQEAAATIVAMLRMGDLPPRGRAVLLNNLTLALVRLGQVGEAREPARMAYESMPSLAHFLIDSFALAAAREGRFADAAELHACSSRIRNDRDEEPDLSEAAAIAETAQLIEANLDEEERSRLRRSGSSMSAAEALMFKVFSQPPIAMAES